MKKSVNYSDLLSVVAKLSNFKIIQHCFDQTYKKIVNTDEIKNLALLNIRTLTPPKIFFFKPKDPISDISFEVENVLLIDVKFCDLKALKILDNMFLKDYIDEQYKTYKDNTFIISSDCVSPKESCFCSIVGGKPYVEKEDGSDINISFVDENNLILEAFSLKGEKFLKENFSEFEPPTESEILKRDSVRKVAERKIIEFNKEFIKEEKNKTKYYLALKNTYDIKDTWKKESEKCVQCGGCNFICPSCYCFLIREASVSVVNQYRDKVWDVCHFTGYARVAGGANPRKYKYQRFRNRYQCKFVYRYENFKMYACSGCGRCIEVCPAKIDIRKVIRNLVLAKGEKVLKFEQ
ncbi:MAG: 4Fe-4S dicluster domain-containing protein [Endomicrobiia bacterium]